MTELISPDPQISLRHQCELLEVCRGSYYYQCCPETEENLALMRRLDQMHLENPVYGSRKLTALLRQEGLEINRKRVVRLLRVMGIEAIYATVSSGSLWLAIDVAAGAQASARCGRGRAEE